MNCKSIEIISSVPYPYYEVQRSLDKDVVDDYIRLYRREITKDNVIRFILYEHNINRRLNYLLMIYELPNDHVFNFKLTPYEIENIHLLFRRFKKGREEFIRIIHQLTGDSSIFSGDDIQETRDLLSVLEARSYKIFKTLY